jgi:hypothetical protein
MPFTAILLKHCKPGKTLYQTYDSKGVAQVFLNRLAQVCILANYVNLNWRTVPHSKSGMVPRSSLLGAGQLGFWEIGKGGTIE